MISSKKHKLQYESVKDNFVIHIVEGKKGRGNQDGGQQMSLVGLKMDTPR